MSQATRAVNLYAEAHDVYAGRPRGGVDPRDVPPGTHGFLGNPFPLGEQDRQRSIALFRDYFADRVQTDSVFRDAVLATKGKRLGCFCAPRACHAEVIAAWLDGRPECQPQSATDQPSQPVADEPLTLF